MTMDNLLELPSGTVGKTLWLLQAEQSKLTEVLQEACIYLIIMGHIFGLADIKALDEQERHRYPHVMQWGVRYIMIFSFSSKYETMQVSRLPHFLDLEHCSFLGSLKIQCHPLMHGSGVFPFLYTASLS